MEFSKEAFYDWFGLNAWLFTHINALHGKWYDAAMITLSQIADYHNFPYYLAALAIYVCLSLTIRTMRNKAGGRPYLVLWVGVFVVLMAGFATEVATIKTLKNHFAYPRPYLVFQADSIRILEPSRVGKGDDNHSFPSGHAAFATMMVTALWPVLAEGTGWIAMLLVFGVCWSRIALGMHFPADVLASVAIMFPLIVIVRAVIYSLLLRYFGLRC